MAKDSIGITLHSDELDKQLERAMRKNPIETIKAARECLLDLAGNSARRAPIESGDLRNDCTATLNNVDIFARQSPIAAIAAPSLRVFGSVGYGLPYALRQHEDLTLAHDRTDGYRRSDGTTVNMVAGGEAKYLERPFDERKDRYAKRFEKVVEDSLK